ncbi:MAG: hypothetical protein AAGI52_06345 [Bacteroidota bacterium]
MLRLFALVGLLAIGLPVSAQSFTAQTEPTVSASDSQEILRGFLYRLISDSQAYFLIPSDFGGGDDSFEGISFAALDYWTNDDGHHVRTSRDGRWTHIYTLEESSGIVTITAASDQTEEVLRATVTGPTLDDIVLTSGAR